MFPLIILILSYKFIVSSYSIKFSNSDSNSDLTVMSYNTSKLIKPGVYSDDFWPKSDEMMAWLSDYEADIKCFQEFYNNDKSKNWNSIEKLGIAGNKYFYFSSDSINHTTGRLGVAILSKFPIINMGEILFSENKFNRAAYADVIVKGDTIRILNVHLQSMEIKTAKPSDKSSLDDIISNLVFIYYRIKHGAMDRSEQTQILLDFIEDTPHKIIVCGDFNETPYGYSYNAFHNKLNNAFEKAGRGFGFTYNGKTLFFLRIDNQFYSDGLKAIELYTLRDIEFSDHFPILGKYIIDKE